MSNMSTTVEKYNWKPSEGRHGELLTSFANNRQTGNFTKEGYYQVGLWEESSWWNRPLDIPNQGLFFIDEEGVGNYNLPLEGKEDLSRNYKARLNILLPKDSVVTVCEVPFDDNWSLEDKLAFANNKYKAVADLLTRMGYGKYVECRSNDMFYNGKKFAGHDSGLFIDKGYREAGVITMYFEKNKRFFDKLSGGGALKSMTGICDEIPELTPDMVIDAIYDYQKAFLEKVYKNN